MEPINPVWIISGMGAAIVGLAWFVRWLVVKVLGVVKSSTEATTKAQSSMDKLTKSIDRLIATIEHEPEKAKRK